MTSSQTRSVKAVGMFYMSELAISKNATSPIKLCQWEITFVKIFMIFFVYHRVLLGIYSVVLEDLRSELDAKSKIKIYFMH